MAISHRKKWLVSPKISEARGVAPARRLVQRAPAVVVRAAHGGAEGEDQLAEVQVLGETSVNISHLG